MTAVVAVLAAVVGAGVGLLSGALAVRLEQVEGLEEEERLEREEFLAEERRRAESAEAAGLTAGEPVVWKPERYGWTPLERIASPALAALGFASFAAHDGLGGALGIHLLWVAVFVHITAFDIKHRLILNRVTYPAIPVALALAPLSSGLTVATAVLGAAAVFLFFLVQSLLFGGSVMGLGDAKLGAIVGATTGLGTDLDHLGAVYAVIAAVLGAGVVAALLLATRVRGLRDPIPYGPFLCAGAALIIFHGPAGP